MFKFPFRLVLLALASAIASVTFAADPVSSAQQRIMDEYTKQLNASVDLSPADFPAYFDNVIRFVKTPVAIDGSDPTAATAHDLLFTMLVADFAPIRMKKSDDENRGERWRQFVRAEIDRRLKTSADAREQEILSGLDVALTGAVPRGESLPPERLAEFEHKLNQLATQWPQSAVRPFYEDRYLSLVEKTDPAAALARAQRLVSDPNPQVSAGAKGRLEVAKSKAEPVQMKFTAVDGREVDLAQLRGKVVLIDFWATWCGPCVAELPNVKRVYEKYHGQGFEVIGISAENANLRPSDTSEQRAEKLQKGREKLIAFTEEKKLAWPQYFDGAHWKNPFITKYNIVGIPAMFLLDQQGRVVETNARGEKLEAEVKRLLTR